MTTIRRFVLRLRSFFRPVAAEAELSREIQSHLQLLEDGFVARVAARRGERRRDARIVRPRALPVTAVVMVIVGMIATLGPARRGLRIQPTEALRAE